MSFYKTICLGLLLSVATGGLVSNSTMANSFYGKQEQGYFWYKDPKEVKPEEPVEKPEAEKKIEYEGPELFSLEWMRKNFDRVKDEAIENPDDKDKVAAYLYMVRMVMDKAHNFANAAHDMVQSDPMLDPNSRVPVTGAARVELLQMESRAKQEVLKEMAEISGLWFFFDTRCKFCSYQYRILQTFQTYHPKMQIRSVSMDGGVFPNMRNVYKDQGQAAAFKINITPAVVLLAPPDKVIILSLGMNTVKELEDKIILAARTEKILSDSYFEALNFYNRGNLTDKDMKGAGANKAVDPDDSKSWVDFLRGKLQEKY